MTASWEQVRRRHRLVEDVLTQVERRGVAAVAAAQEVLQAEYDEGVAGFLLDLHRRWQRAFDARLDALLEEPPDDLSRAVAGLWHTLAADLSATRLVLDAYSGHPAVARAAARHRRHVLAGTGVDLAGLAHPSTTPTDGAPHDREHRAHDEPSRRRLRLRPLCARLHRRPVPAA